MSESGRESTDQLTYFGPYWAYDPTLSAQTVPEPEPGSGIACPYCVKEITPGRRGVRRAPPSGPPQYWHVMCWLVAVLGEAKARDAQRSNAQLQEEPFPDDRR